MYERPSSRRTWAKFQALLTICWLSLLMMLLRAFRLLPVALTLALVVVVGLRRYFLPSVPVECVPAVCLRVRRSGLAAPTFPRKPASRCFGEGGRHAVSYAQPK